MFKKILIANRGEIAVRVIRACRELGLKAVAIFSDADRSARHVQLADESWHLEGQPARAYLDMPQIVELARRSGAQAIHPGYGFLAENADFAEVCSAAAVTFIGPRPDVIRRMGSKLEARRLMEAAGVPVVPGGLEPVTDAAAVRQLGTKYGYPIAIKASAGGGGRGLRVVRTDEEVEQALQGAQREGLTYFGDSKVYIEKYLDRPRHIEVQILADQRGNVVNLGERDCSSQRRHQKLLEETPAANLDPQLRQRLLVGAVRGASSIGYTSAGTIECLVYGNDFYFLEVNTRVQVEHPITEMTTGIDIVREQILIAAGERLSFSQADVVPRGHAIECRINAEDPFKNFLPSPGTITAYKEPAMPWVRVDSACYSGYQVLPFYDSLIAKLVVWGRTRDEAIARTRQALNEFVIEGVKTTIPFHQILLDDANFRAGYIYTLYVESELKKRLLQEAVALPSQPGADQLLAQAAASGQATERLERRAPRTFEVDINQRHFKVAVTELVQTGDATTGQDPPTAKAAAPARPRRQAKAHDDKNGGEVRASMHGVVKELCVSEGDPVTAGQRLLVFEAMKMESEILASRAGRVLSLKARAGETVEAEQVLVVLGD